MASVDYLFDSWGYDPEKIAGGEFAVGNTIGDRLEAEVGKTTFVGVPMTRDAAYAEEVYTNVLTVTDGAVSYATNVIWQVGETEKFVRVDTAKRAHEAGDAMELNLSDLDELTNLDSAITFVERENSPKNPTWVGARTEDTLKWGEWTMDIDVATNKVAAFNKANPGKRAYSLALVGGSLWCPDCARTDAYLVDADAFKDWAASNHVACISVDIPSDPTVGGPCLLTRDVKEVSAKYIEADPDHGAKQSGAGYLSRWMIGDEGAAAVMSRNAKLVGTNTLKGGWNRPERANQKRTGVPIFILLREDGTIAGRIETFASTSPDDDSYVKGNLLRLDELLATIDREGGESDFHPSTTRRAADAQEGLDDAELSGAHQATTILLTNTVDFATLAVTADGETTCGLDNKLSVYVETNGVIDLVKSVTGNFSDGVIRNTVELSITNGHYFARLEIADLADLEKFGVNRPIRTRAKIRSDLEYHSGTVAFEEAKQSVFVPDGEGSVTVSRTGGAYGTASVQVRVADAGTAEGFYEFTETNLVWNAGERDDKTVDFTVFRTGELASGDFTLELRAGPGNEAEVSAGKHVVTLNDTTDPCFEKFDIRVGSWLKFAIAEILELRNVDASKSVTVKKTSGALPPGLKLTYNRKSGVVELTGTATKPGIYTATYTVTQGKKTGLPATITIVVADPTSENPYVNTKRSSQIIPLMTASGTNDVVAGTLTVSVTAANKISAKYQGTESKTLAFSGAWSDIDEDGTAWAIIADKNGNELKLSLDCEGTLSAQLTVLSAYTYFTEDAYATFTGSVGLPATAFSAWAGVYNVTLVDRETAPQKEPCGTGYLTFSVSAKGVVKWSGVLANGTAVSGSSQLDAAYEDAEGDAAADVALFKRAPKDVFGALVSIKSNGASVWTDTTYLQLIHDVGISSSYLLHRETGFQYLGYAALLGGWYDQNIAPDKLCETFSYDPEGLALNFATDRAEASEKNGALEPIDASALEATSRDIVISDGADGVKFSFTKKTGLFSGSATLCFANGKSVKGTYKGVLMPGWENCGCVEGRTLYTRPFGSGTFYFKDMVNGRSVMRSLPVDVVAEKSDL